MTVPDSRPVLDVIADAVAAALPDALQPVGAGLRNPPEMGGDLTGYGQQIVDAVTPAVLAACQGATVAQQRELTGAEIERALFGRAGGLFRSAVDAEDELHLRRMAEEIGGEMRARLVGPWREDPS